MITYDDAIRTLVLPDIEYLVPDGQGHSMPVLSMENGRLLDNFFVCSAALRSGRGTVPSARLTVDVPSQKLVRYSTALENPFLQLEEKKALSVKKRTVPELEEIFGQHRVCYQQLRTFAFRSCLTGEQKQILALYLETLFELAQCTRSFYVQLSPSFFAWARENL